MKRFIYILIGVMTLSASAQIRKALPETDMNDLQQVGWQIQHSSLSFDKQTIVFSARKPGKGHYDLFIAKRDGSKWSSPTPLESVNTNQDELWPSMSSDENQIYFVRRTPADPKDKKSEEQFHILVTTRSDETWDSGQTIVISDGHDISPLILPDNQTLLFASKRKIPDRKEQAYALYFTRRLGKYNWYLPELLIAPEEKGENFYGISLQTGGETQQLNYTKQLCSKKDTIYSTGYFPLPEKCQALPILTLSGSVKEKENQKYMSNVISVYDAITSQLITTLKNDGRFTIALPAGKKYLLDITAPHYSHVYLEYDCLGRTRDASETQHILLAKQLNIHINVFDAEMQTPLNQVQCTPYKLVRNTKNGLDASLPIGEIYTLQLSKQGYESRELVINTRKEVLLPYSELDIDLTPGKAPLQVTLYDIDTKEPVAGNVLLSNQAREERLTYSDSTRLRQGDQYALNANATCYLYYDTIINVPYSDAKQTCAIGLRKIRQEMVLQLRNIQFEYNSASLLESSYEELDKVVQLLKENAGLSIELSAHTDDLGTDSYNDKLSQRRGEAARNYLIKHGIEASRVSAIGYGKRKPLVPNDSEENRAINRRVEFKVTGI